MFGKPKKKIKITTIDDLPLAQRVKVREGLHAMYPKIVNEYGEWTPPKSANTDTAKTKAVKRGMGDSAGGIKTDQEKYEEAQKKRGKK